MTAISSGASVRNRAGSATSLRRAPVVSLRVAVTTSLGLFLVLWMVSAEQYLFCPIIALAAMSIGRVRLAHMRLDALEVAALLIGLLSVTAVTWTEYRSVAIRSADVWLTAFLLSVTYRHASPRGQRYLVQCLMGVWLMSVGIYFVSQFAPGITDALTALRRPVTNTVAVGFSTESLIFNLEVNRPIGFLLYANELALFGLLIVAVRLHRFPISRWLGALYVGISLYFLLLSTSRTIILSTLLTASVLLVNRLGAARVSPLHRAIRTATVCVGALTVLLFAQPDFLANLERERAALETARYGNSDELRNLSYTVGEKLALANPLTGVGGLPQLGRIQAGSHSLPLSLLVRYGLPGLALLLIFLAVLGYRGVIALFSDSISRAWVGGALCVALTSCLTIQFDDDIFSLAGVVLAASVLKAGGTEREPPAGTVAQASTPK